MVNLLSCWNLQISQALETYPFITYCLCMHQLVGVLLRQCLLRLSNRKNSYKNP